VLSGLVPSYFVVRRQGFGSHILVTQDPSCDLSLIIRGDGNSLRQQSPEFPLVNLSILTASFYKHCCWRWPSDIDQCGSGALVVQRRP
jgi:hypothetical protein